MKVLIVVIISCYIYGINSSPINDDGDFGQEKRDYLESNSNRKEENIDENLKADIKLNSKELLSTAESNGYVYRPLFLYRRIEHSKRRITMYNSFAG